MSGHSSPWMNEVLELVKRGEKIAAISRYRAETGVDLAEAKRSVERMEQTLRNPDTLKLAHPDQAATLRNRVLELLESEGIIAAVRYLRDQTGWGLRESKTYIDRVIEEDSPRIARTANLAMVPVILLAVLIPVVFILLLVFLR